MQTAFLVEHGDDAEMSMSPLELEESPTFSTEGSNRSGRLWRATYVLVALALCGALQLLGGVSL